MSFLTGKQCKTARLLLKWNVRELAFRVAIKPADLQRFEKGERSFPLGHRENLLKLFRKEGLEFLDDGEVRLKRGEDRPQPSHGGGGGGEAKIHEVSAEEFGLLRQTEEPAPRPKKTEKEEPRPDES